MITTFRKLILPLLLIAVMFSGCNCDEREYLADIVLPLEKSPGEIVIKEWRWLLGSGAEVYYRLNGKQTLLGTTTGGDDGYCPFADGKYIVTLDGEELLIRWRFEGDGLEEDIWKEERFTLPKS